MPTFPTRFHRVIQLLHAAGVKHAAVTTSAGAEWFMRPNDEREGSSLDAYLLLDAGDFPAAKAALEAAGMPHRHAGTVELFLDHPDAPDESGVRIAFPGAQVELRTDSGRQEKLDAEFLEYLRLRALPVTVTAREELDRLIATHVKPELKASGFKKNARIFNRRVGSLIQLIAFEASWTSHRQETSFDIQLGIWSERVAALKPWHGDAPPLPKTGIPRIWDCHWQVSLSMAFPKFRTIPFTCQADSDNAETAAHVRDGIFNHALPLLDALKDDAALLKHLESVSLSANFARPLVQAALYRLEGAPGEFDAFTRSFLEPHSEWDVRAFQVAFDRMRSAQFPND